MTVYQHLKSLDIEQLAYWLCLYKYGRCDERMPIDEKRKEKILAYLSSDATKGGEK